MGSDACLLSPWGIVCSRGLSQRQAAWGVGSATLAACWWCQLWGRQTAPFRSLLDPVAVPHRQAAAQSQWGVGGAAPDGPSSLQEARVLSLRALRGPGCLGVVGPLLHPRADAQGRGLQKAPLPAFLPCQLPPGLSHHLKHLLPPRVSHPSEDSAVQQIPQHPKSPWAPLPPLHCHSSPLGSGF